MSWVEHVACMDRNDWPYSIFIGNFEETTRDIYRLENIIKNYWK